MTRDETTGPRTFEAWGYKTLFVKAVGRVAIIGHIKNKLKVWALGFEIMSEPKGFCIFLGPVSVGFFRIERVAS